MIALQGNAQSTEHKAQSKKSPMEMSPKENLYSLCFILYSLK